MGNPLEFYFEVLNIPTDSSPQEIRNAYKSLVKKWHPDKHPPASRPEAEAKFKIISQAYEALNDQQENRAMLDACNEGNWVNKGNINQGTRQEKPEKPSPGSSADFQKEFKTVYFSKSASSPGNAPGAKPAVRSNSAVVKKLPALEKKLVCTLEELLHGCNKEVKFSRDVIIKNGFVVRKMVTQIVKVKPGWKKGTKVTFKEMGDERPGYLPADVVYTILEKEHPIFKRVGNDLVLKVEVPLVNALTGWTFSFRLLNGEKISCSFNDKIIYPGYEKIVKGQGMPLSDGKGARGDLRIKFNILFPTQLSDEQRSSIKELLNDSS